MSVFEVLSDYKNVLIKFPGVLDIKRTFTKMTRRLHVSPNLSRQDPVCITVYSHVMNHFYFS